jgi:hypothetical protein
MVGRHHRAFAGPIGTTARPVGGDVTRSDGRSAGDRPATTPQWGRAVAAAVAAAILGFYLPSLLARGPADGPPATACDRAAVETFGADGC